MWDCESEREVDGAVECDMSFVAGVLEVALEFLIAESLVEPCAVFLSITDTSGLSAFFGEGFDFAAGGVFSVSLISPSSRLSCASEIFELTVEVTADAGAVVGDVVSSSP